jgi:hypothetical protein
MKTCNKCKKEKSLSEYFNDKAATDGKYSICKECKQQSTYKWRANNKEKYNNGAKDWRRNNPEKEYGHEIKRRYGCTLEMYNNMLVQQDGACAICRKLHDPAIKKGRLSVDHCHKTGKIRALLCGACNSALGYLKDDVELMLKAIEYIKRHT